MLAATTGVDFFLVTFSSLPTGYVVGSQRFVQDGKNTDGSLGVLATCTAAHAGYANGAAVTH